MKAVEVLEAARTACAQLVAVNGKILAQPAGLLSDVLREQVRVNEAELLRLRDSTGSTEDDRQTVLKLSSVRSEATAAGFHRQQLPQADNLGSLRRLCPLLWCPVRTRDGRQGLLWRVGPVDVAVSFDPQGPIYTLHPSNVELIDD